MYACFWQRLITTFDLNLILCHFSGVILILIICFVRSGYKKSNKCHWITRSSQLPRLYTQISLPLINFYIDIHTYVCTTICTYGAALSSSCTSVCSPLLANKKCWGSKVAHYNYRRVVYMKKHNLRPLNFFFLSFFIVLMTC